MNRCLAFLLAVLFASITISSACVAQPRPDVVQMRALGPR